LALTLLSACATQTNKDPLEGMNRGIYKFNDIADKALIKPVATVYKTITPSPVRTGFNNFFSNLGSITTVLNDLFQFKFTNAFTDAGRFVINSTFGIAGFIDVAGMDNIDINVLTEITEMAEDMFAFSSSEKREIVQGNANQRLALIKNIDNLPLTRQETREMVDVAIEQLDRGEGIDGDVVISQLRDKLRQSREIQG
jgi:hypothetical protein